MLATARSLNALSNLSAVSAPVTRNLTWLICYGFKTVSHSLERIVNKARLDVVAVSNRRARELQM